MNYIFHGYRNEADHREPGDGWHYGPFPTKEAADNFAEKQGQYFAEWAICRIYEAD